MILGALLGGPVGAVIGAGLGNKLIGLGASRGITGTGTVDPRTS